MTISVHCGRCKDMFRASYKEIDRIEMEVGPHRNIFDSDAWRCDACKAEEAARSIKVELPWTSCGEMLYFEGYFYANCRDEQAAKTLADGMNSLAFRSHPEDEAAERSERE